LSGVQLAPSTLCLLFSLLLLVYLALFLSSFENCNPSKAVNTRAGFLCLESFSPYEHARGGERGFGERTNKPGLEGAYELWICGLGVDDTCKFCLVCADQVTKSDFRELRPAEKILWRTLGLKQPDKASVWIGWLSNKEMDLTFESNGNFCRESCGEANSGGRRSVRKLF
jgi:hypothetical protein